MLPVHLAALGWMWAVHGERVGGEGPGPALPDGTILVLLPFLYAQLPLLMAGVPGEVVYGDPAIQSLEAGLFGGQPAFDWASALPSRVVSEVLHLGYLLYYPLIYLPPAVLFLGLTGPRGDEARAVAFQQTMLALGVAVVGAFLIMIVFPVQGPRYLGVPEGVPAGPVRAAVLLVLETGSSRGAAFPSSHVSVAVAQTLLALRWQPRVGYALALVTVLLGAGAVYGGFHYAVDVVAGAALGLVAGVVALRSGPRVPGETRRSERG
jgi:membrane-associated phospholipid phosphatase